MLIDKRLDLLWELAMQTHLAQTRLTLQCQSGCRGRNWFGVFGFVLGRLAGLRHARHRRIAADELRAGAQASSLGLQGGQRLSSIIALARHGLVATKVLRVESEQLLELFTAELLLTLLRQSLLVLCNLGLETLLRADHLLHHAEVVRGVLFVQGLHHLKHARLFLHLRNIVHILVKDRNMLVACLWLLRSRLALLLGLALVSCALQVLITAQKLHHLG